MEEFKITEILSFLSRLQEHQSEISTALEQQGPAGMLSDEARRRLMLHFLEPFSALCDELHLKETIHRIVLAGERSVLPPCGLQVIAVELEGLRRTFERELGDSKSSFIKPSNREFFEQDALMGSIVNKRFPSAKADIRDAGNCLAVDLNTAAIFHLMRVVEIGLRALARHLRVPIKTNQLEYLEWQSIIEQIENVISKIKQKPKGKKKSEALELYHGMMGEFNAFKDVWRNNVMHARKTYDEHQAMSVYLHVREFMRRLASEVSKNKRK